MHYRLGKTLSLKEHHLARKKVILKQNIIFQRNCLLDTIPVDLTNTLYIAGYDFPCSQSIHFNSAYDQHDSIKCTRSWARGVTLSHCKQVMVELQFPGMAEEQQAHADSEQSVTDDFQTDCMCAPDNSE